MLEHEISETFGRFASLGKVTAGGKATYSILDFFRWPAPGVRALTGGSADYFSLDNGVTSLGVFNDPNQPSTANPALPRGGDAGDWISTGNTANDAFDAFLFSGTNYTLSSLDSTVLNAIGLSATCFLEGTRIETSDRERTVEELIVGGRLPSLFKGFGQVVWIGKREIELSRHPAPAMVRPVRIRAGAFGTGRPFRDLYLSPDHAVLVDGVLIQVKRLFNGNSIQPIMMDGFVYYHIELETHDIIRAEGLPVETYLDAGDRSTFANPLGVPPALPGRQ